MSDPEEVEGIMAYGYRLAATRLAHLEADSAGPHWRALRSPASAEAAWEGYDGET